MNKQMEVPKPKKAPTNEKPIPHIPLPFEEVMKDVLMVKPPEKSPLEPKQQKTGKRKVDSYGKEA